MKDTIAIFKVGNTQFQIYQESNSHTHHALRADSKGPVIIGFNVTKSLKAVKELLISQNVKIRGYKIAAGNPPVEMLFIEDFGGNEICLSRQTNE